MSIKLYRHPLSGHSHRVELFLSLLDLKVEIIDVDLMQGEHKKPEFLQKNPSGQVPVLEDKGHFINDSNAILIYLAATYASGSDWYPADVHKVAEIQKFLSTAAGSVAFGPAAARLVNVFGAGINHEQAINTAHGFLNGLEQHLQGRDWLVGDSATIADVANYAYVARAPEGSVSLDKYSLVRAWLQRIEALPGFVPMQKTAVGLAA